MHLLSRGDETIETSPTDTYTNLINNKSQTLIQYTNFKGIKGGQKS